MTSENTFLIFYENRVTRGSEEASTIAGETSSMTRRRDTLGCRDMR